MRVLDGGFVVGEVEGVDGGGVGLGLGFGGVEGDGAFGVLFPALFEEGGGCGEGSGGRGEGGMGWGWVIGAAWLEGDP